MLKTAAPFRRLLKVLLYILIVVAILYAALILMFGGYGKKPDTLNRPKNGTGLTLFAHRALSLYYPESSMEAVQGAKRKGFSGVELDIQKDGDGDLVIFHDEDCERLLGIKASVDTMPLAEIKKYPLIFNEKKSNSYVASLKEVLDVYKDSLLFYFDMKLRDFKTADDIVNMIKTYDIEKSCIVANSDILFLFYIEFNYPEINTVLEGFDAGKEWNYYLLPKSLKPDFFSGFSWNLDQNHVNWLKKKGLLNNRIVYGVGVENVKTMLDYGFTNLILDYDTTMTNVKLFD